jgi:hypothetical protein
LLRGKSSIPESPLQPLAKDSKISCSIRKVVSGAPVLNLGGERAVDLRGRLIKGVLP